jgi:hypothetical protein
MPLSIAPQKVMQAAHNGWKRLQNFRKARMMFLRNYRGPYYDETQGEIGSEPLNMIFNAIRIFVPNIVLNYPKATITSPYLATREYGELMGLAIDQQSEKLDIKTIYRCVIVDAIFTLGILKTGICQSDSIYALDDFDRIDNGEIYTKKVDFDRYVVDPMSMEHMFMDARFEGDIITVPRRVLLESGLYNSEQIIRLPKLGDKTTQDKAYSLSMRSVNSEDAFGLEDEVEVIELWVPGADALVTIPADPDVDLDDYLRVDDFYGVNEGPYTKLSFSPPMPGNPLPVPAVGIWNDLHVLSNLMAKKVIDQAMRQRDVAAYKGSSADDADELLNAKDGESVKVDDPEGVKVHSFGGQQNSNEMFLAQCQSWFNGMAANPQGVGGERMDADSATEAKILAGNSNIGLEDAKDLVYCASASEMRRRGWFIHTDPLVNLPLIRRQSMPAQYMPGPQGPMMIAPSTIQDVQVFLTPEARSGDFFDFVWRVQPESMGRKDSNQRLMDAMNFFVKVMPAIMGAAQVAFTMGLPFSPKAAIIRMGKDSGLDWLDEAFNDPEFQMMMAQRLLAGPSAEGSKGEAAPKNTPDMASQVAQNGQPANVASQPGMMEQFAAEFQAGANQGQSQLKQGAF